MPEKIATWADLETVNNKPTADQQEIDRTYVRTFVTSNDGARVLAHLRATFLDVRYGPDASNAQLRHAEGGRAVVEYIISRIKAGQQR